MKELDALLDSLNGSAERFQTLWFSFLGLTLYLAITALATTHRNLLLGDPQILPILNIKVELLPFYVIAPLLYLVFHFYLLIMLVLLARTAAPFEKQLQMTLPNEVKQEKYRARVENALFLQLLIGMKDERAGVNSYLLAAIALITIVLAPLATLILIQMRFLPYHHLAITWWHRVLMIIDLGVVLVMWRRFFYDSGIENPLLLFRDRPYLRSRLALTANFGAVALALWLSLWEGRWAGEDWIGRPTKPDWRGGVVWGLFPDRVSLPNEPVVGEDLFQKSQMESEQLGKPVPTRSFAGRNLQAADLSGADLRGVEFKGAHMEDADLREAELQGADFDGAHLQRAILRGAQLRNAHRQAKFKGADLSGARFSPGAPLAEAELQGAHLAKTELADANLQGAHLQGADFDGGHLQGADFRSAQFRDDKDSTPQLQNADLRGAKLQGVDLKMAQLRGAFLSSTQLTGANLDGADLSEAHLPGAHLESAHLSDAQLQGADLIGAFLQDAILKAAKLQGANLTSAHLERADLNAATLCAAELRFASLQGADLEVADLRGARLDGAGLEGADLGGLELGEEVFRTQLQGADFTDAKLQGANLADAEAAASEFDGTSVFRTDIAGVNWGEAKIGSIDADSGTVNPRELTGWIPDATDFAKPDTQRDEIVQRFHRLQANFSTPGRDAIEKAKWTGLATLYYLNDSSGAKYRTRLATILGDLACELQGGPFAARAIIDGNPKNIFRHSRLETLGEQLDGFRARLENTRKDPKSCPGAAGLSEQDWQRLEKIKPVQVQHLLDTTITTAYSP